MPQPGLAADIKKMIHGVVTNNPKRTAGEIRNDLRAKGIPEDRLPSERTIARAKKAFLATATDQDRRVYRYLAWPDSMLDESMPWAASASIMELLGWHRERGDSRATISQGQWFWRITLAAKDLSIHWRVSLAQHCADLAPASQEFEAVQAYLEFGSWRSAEGKATYEKAIADGRIMALPEDIPFVTATMPNVTQEDKERAWRMADEQLAKEKEQAAKKVAPKHRKGKR